MRIGRVVAGTMALAAATIMATSESAAASVTPRIGSGHTYSGRQNTPSVPLHKGIGVAQHQYRIAVYTGKKDGAGTDANVYITINGTRGSVGPIRLDNSGNNFERGKTDRFTLGLRDVGRITSIKISHDNSGKKPGWYLNKVTIDVNAKFSCYRWLAKDEDDHRTWVKLPRDRHH
ncbi:PLAT/LH2 domain-containing protein [Streptomyces sp. 2323.1]|uniref:PLAT/LH2 domain-containing protein n=1 Tax=Streptomyces sp. 2323.1 TaxID=1938841 RepID=UPI000BBFC253|nr:PLAT/LH2 domain-containing protein [Streptomyces sp. 2323.1]SOE16238.1 PLAT/LH2 domain-containing protein [Streptomyces sp. 2323.1]